MYKSILKKGQWFLVAALLSVAVHAQTLLGDIPVAQLPSEAQYSLALIKRGGPYPFAKDGAVFGNYERVLPERKRGYYHEYTVRTPGSRSRGARRIIAGGVPTVSGEYYYTADHYSTFRRIKE